MYKENSSLNLIGLVRNLGQLYIKWEMFEEAARFHEFILAENDKERILTLSE